MSQFFVGWRRKAGLALLVLALAFAGLWVRSYTYFESAYRYGSTTIHEVSSEYGHLIWSCDRRSPKSSHRLNGVLYDWNSSYFPEMTSMSPYELRDPLNQFDIDWQWKWGGFSFGSGTETAQISDYCLALAASRDDPEKVSGFKNTTHLLRHYFDRRAAWVVPYWSLVLPLTLLSGFLLLIQPKKLSRPTPNPPESV